MPRKSLPAVPRICQQCGEAWVQRDGKAPRAYCTTSCQNEAERQGASAAPLPHIPEEPPLPIYTRRVRAQQHTITCAWCQQVATLEQYPGPAPRYCSAACRAEAARESAAARMRRMRARRQQETPAVTRSESS